MSVYAARNDVKNYKISGEKVDLSDYGGSEIDAAIDVAEAVIDSITNDVFCALTQTNLFDGSGMPVLFFSPKVVIPLISVTSVKELDPTDGATLDTLVEGTDFIAYPHHLEITGSTDGSVRRSVLRGGTWARGQINIEVIGSWGRATVPLEIKEATILLALERLIPGSTNMLPQGVTQAIWNDFTLTLNKASDMIGEQTGFPAVDRILRRHINYADMFQSLSDLALSDGYQPLRTALGRPL